MHLPILLAAVLLSNLMLSNPVALADSSYLETPSNNPYTSDYSPRPYQTGSESGPIRKDEPCGTYDISNKNIPMNNNGNVESGPNLYENSPSYGGKGLSGPCDPAYTTDRYSNHYGPDKANDPYGQYDR